MAPQFLDSTIGKTLAAATLGLMPGHLPAQKNLPRTGRAFETPLSLAQFERPAQLMPDDFTRTKSEVSTAFSELVEQWKKDTQLKSDSVAILMHPAHYKIIGLGPQVLPSIFADLAAGGGPWFVALESITHEDPIAPEHRMSAKKMRADWVKWGIEHGYVRE